MTTAEVIKFFNGKAKTARALGLTYQAVQKWGGHPPLLRQFEIERLTDGQLRAEQRRAA